MLECFAVLLTATRGSIELQSKTMDSITVQLIATGGSEVLQCEMVKEIEVLFTATEGSGELCRKWCWRQDTVACHYWRQW